MILLFVIAFISGLVTILAPCIWPLLPIIMSTSLGATRSKSLGITTGIILSFSVFTLSISYLVSVLRFDPEILRYFAVVVIGFLGLTLALPPLSRFLEVLVSRLSGKFVSPANSQRKTGFWGGFTIGLALGLVWTPCAGPILATVATLAATKAVNLGIVLVTIVYLIGIAIPLFFFSTGSSAIFSRVKIFNKYTGRIQQVFGIVLVIMAILIFKGWDRTLQAKLLDAFPSYSSFLTKFETTGGVQKELERLKEDKSQSQSQSVKSNLKVLGDAPDFVGIEKWLNSDPLSIKDLNGKVILVDFWTYTCINCIRTLPYVTSWYDKYHDKGFVVIGVHTPEFEFEKKTENVEGAINQYKINYPVAQDNNYDTWNNYNNRYWPAKYLIDANGRIRYTHFGEGQYKETEENIQSLLKEAGQSVHGGVQGDDGSGIGFSLDDKTTPETYLGSSRAQAFDLGGLVNGLGEFDFNKNPPKDRFSLGGRWQVEDEYIESASGSKLSINYFAKKVHLVITPKSAGEKVNLYLDGKFYKNITLDSERLYDLVETSVSERHTLEIEFATAGIRIFAFTFGQ